LVTELKSFSKEAYYYKAQVEEYKALLKDPDKMEEKAMGILRNSAAFKDFMAKNSMLSSLFPTPGNYGTAPALQGLQTRTAVQQQLSAQIGGAGGQQYLQQQVQAAQAQLNALKDKINKLGGGSGDLEMPDFKPNNQKTKSFLQRIEYGLNIQSQKTNALLPVTSDIALTAGYKLNDKSVIGIGAGYKLGWGKNISNIHLSSQGLSLRSYADIKLKGSIWISGGYEYNYQHEFEKIDQLKDLDAWQKSGLLGLTKKYKIGKKNGNMQLLWDFLSYSQVPRTTALKFRVGYTL
jgi:prefoldin subunit 5